ncbi:hypothetical protein [Agaribacterium haliotis]|uniref:hypothetical protein n=1 Tax=Agaribacterium haliotis TaxID=2013869 RepID=UPI000BB53EA4|nr:hypothetical protein [Agaribacterium haliotis]
MNVSSTNSDLIWKLAGFNYPEQAVSFLKRFESSFCVFSRTVSQLYSNYEMQRAPGNKSVVVLPNPFAHHDNYNDIPEEAILPTGMIVSPGEIRGEQDWLLCYRDGPSRRWKGMELAQGLAKFHNKYGADDPFLPVLMNTDLRKCSRKEQPLMHLHRISLKKLEQLSELQRKDIQLTINDKLKRLGRLMA